MVDDLNDIVQDNDTVALDMGGPRESKYLIYPYLDNMEKPPEYYTVEDAQNYTYSMSWTGGPYENFTLVDEYESETGFLGFEGIPFIGKPGGDRDKVWLWKRI